MKIVSYLGMYKSASRFVQGATSLISLLDYIFVIALNASIFSCNDSNSVSQA